MKSEGIITLQKAPISSALSFPGGSKLCTSLEYSMRASVLFAAASWRTSPFAYVAKTWGKKSCRASTSTWNIKKLLAQPLVLFQQLVSVSSSLNICKDFQVSDTGIQEVSYAIVHICLHTYYMQLDKSNYWQLSLARGWETDTSKSADFPSLIRISKGNFPKEKHFNTTSLMTHQHVGLCTAYVTFACHN